MPTVKVVANPSKEDGMPESVQETVRAHLDHGKACLDKGKYDDAIANYTRAIELDHKNCEAYISRAMAYMPNGELDRAIADFDKAIALNPNYALAYTNRGVVYGRKGEFDRAIADFRKVLAIDPSHQDAKEGLKRLATSAPVPLPAPTTTAHPFPMDLPNPIFYALNNDEKPWILSAPERLSAATNGSKRTRGASKYSYSGRQLREPPDQSAEFILLEALLITSIGLTDILYQAKREVMTWPGRLRSVHGVVQVQC